MPNESKDRKVTAAMAAGLLAAPAVLCGYALALRLLYEVVAPALGDGWAGAIVVVGGFFSAFFCAIVIVEREGWV
jgi:hypothetical protein